MKKWALLVAGLYVLVFLVLLVPLMWLAFFSKGPNAHDLKEMLMSWQSWALIATLLIAQFALLRVPVAAASGRPVAKRSVWSTVIAASFMMGVLALGLVASAIEVLTKAETGLTLGLVLALSVGVVSWIFWSVYFYQTTRTLPGDEQTKKLQSFLWKGSILELLVAIPSHIIVRQREECCAGIATFIGLTCGMSVMLFAFGPSVYFLLVERMKRLRR